MTALKSCGETIVQSIIENPDSKIGISPLPPEPDFIDLHAAIGFPRAQTWC